MNEVLEFLQNAKVFYFSTIDNNKPRVRPYGFVMEFENKIYFATFKTFGSYSQLVANPCFSISAMFENKWIELSGEAIFDERMVVKEKSFEVMPQIKGFFKSPDNPDYILFYVTGGKAIINSFKEPPREITF
jgi:uncharacterized pyridoxamine 5'-phosphate oxidase family protein